MKKIFLIILTLVLLSSLSLANYVFEPDELDLSGYIGDSKDYLLQITSLFNETIYNITFSDVQDLTFPKIDQIGFNESINVTINFNPTGARNEQYQSTLKGFTYSLINQEQESKIISVYPTNFTPQETTIKQGDSINFTNKDTISHKLVSGGFEEDINLAPNETKQVYFNEIDSFTFSDFDFGFSGVINIVNKTYMELVYSPDYDKQLTINFESLYKETEIEIQLIDDSFSISIGDESDGLIRVKNIGGKVAKNITLSGEWVTFDENDFDLSSNTQKYIEFTVTPTINSTGESNQTYTKTIYVKGENLETKTVDYEVFIPYYDIDLESSSEQDILEWFNDVYCGSHPNSIFCNRTPNYINNESVVYRDAEVTLNVSEKDLYDLLRSPIELKDAVSTLTGIVNDLTDIVESNNERVSQVTTKVEETQEMFEESEKQKDMEKIFYGIGVMIIILAVLIYILIKIKDKIKKKFAKQETENYG